MDIKGIKKPLTQFIKAVSRRVKVDDLIVFGSQIEGSATQESDIDVLVISNEFQTMDEDTRLQLLYSVSDHIKPEIHPWGFTQKELGRMSNLTTVGYIREHGLHWSQIL